MELTVYFFGTVCLTLTAILFSFVSGQRICNFSKRISDLPRQVCANIEYCLDSRKNGQTGLSEFEIISYRLYSEIFEEKKKRDIFLRKL